MPQHVISVAADRAPTSEWWVEYSDPYCIVEQGDLIYYDLWLVPPGRIYPDFTNLFMPGNLWIGRTWGEIDLRHYGPRIFRHLDSPHLAGMEAASAAARRKRFCPNPIYSRPLPLP